MHLINVWSLELETFNAKIPKYAILSHTWQDEEITFDDITRGKSDLKQLTRKAGWQKVVNASRQAKDHQCQYIWIDTCCIDKSSSAELSEAINSMFQWYQAAKICFAYLSDVNTARGSNFDTPVGGKEFDSARWFTRGWTLQELIASRELVFYDANWSYLGNKTMLRIEISAATRIDRRILDNPDLLNEASVAERMSWAANRRTTRDEDLAYCLLGIFGINMPLIYGEGFKAFIRLQDEIMKEFEDYTLFAWSLPEHNERLAWVTKAALEDKGMLALHPACFRKSTDFVPYQSPHSEITSTPRGIKLQTVLLGGSLALYCFSTLDPAKVICIPMEAEPVSGRYYRDAQQQPLFVEYRDIARESVKDILVHKSGRNVAPERAFLSSISIGQIHFDLQLEDARILSPIDLSENDSSVLILKAVEEYCPWDTDDQVCLFPQATSLRYTWLLFYSQSHKARILVVARLFRQASSISAFDVTLLPSWRSDLAFLILRDLQKVPVAKTTTTLPIYAHNSQSYSQLRFELVQSTVMGRLAYSIDSDYIRNDQFIPIPLHEMSNDDSCYDILPCGSNSVSDWEDGHLLPFGVPSVANQSDEYQSETPDPSHSGGLDTAIVIDEYYELPGEPDFEPRPRIDPSIPHSQILCKCCFGYDPNFTTVSHSEDPGCDGDLDPKFVSLAYDVASYRRYGFWDHCQDPTTSSEVEVEVASEETLPASLHKTFSFEMDADEIEQFHSRPTIVVTKTADTESQSIAGADTSLPLASDAVES